MYWGSRFRSICRGRRLKPWIDRFTFQSKYSEYAFVDAPERLAGNEAFQGFQA
jgi:hypothetical protein